MKINIDLELLRTLVAFADTGSFKLASRLVFRSQPAVSMQMKKLERLAGQQLFERQGRDVVLTSLGQQMVQSARELLSTHDRLVGQLRGEEIRGEVRIGMPDDYAHLVLSHILHRFDEYYPAVTLNILTNTTPVLDGLLHDGQLDIAILATLQPQPTDIILAKEPIVWVASEESVAVARRPLVLALFSDESPVYRATMAALQSTARDHGDPVDFRVGVLSKSSSVLLAVAATGFAVATMARCVVPKGFNCFEMAEGFPRIGDVYIVVRATPDTQSSAASQLIETIVDAFAGDSMHASPAPLGERVAVAARPGLGATGHA